MDFDKVKYIIEIFIINYCILGNVYKSYGIRFIVYFDISFIIIKIWLLFRIRIGKMVILVEF